MTDLSQKARRQKLLYRCSKRGTKENELRFSAFAAKYLDQLSVEELDDLEVLLDCPDPELAVWLEDPERVPEAYNTSVFWKVCGV